MATVKQIKLPGSDTLHNIGVTGLTGSRALVSNSSGELTVSAVTSTELGHLDGVTSSVQTQLNNKLDKAGGEATGDITLKVTSGNSPSVIFQRGTLTDNYNDWRIQNRGGYLYFDQRGQNSTDWQNLAYITQSALVSTGTVQGTQFTGPATKLTTTTAGSTTQPVYFDGGIPKAIGYTIETSVPSGAKFTDTTYSAATISANGLMSSTDKAKLNKILKFTNTSVAASAFTSNTTYSDYPYRASITLSEVTADMSVDVIFNVTESLSGNFAPVTNSYAGGVYIYAKEKPPATITIPMIKTC